MEIKSNLPNIQISEFELPIKSLENLFYSFISIHKVKDGGFCFHAEEKSENEIYFYFFHSDHKTLLKFTNFLISILDIFSRKTKSDKIPPWLTIEDYKNFQTFLKPCSLLGRSLDIKILRKQKGNLKRQTKGVFYGKDFIDFDLLLQNPDWVSFIKMVSKQYDYIRHNYL